MRIVYLAPLVAVFGCAHQASETQTPSPTASVSTPSETPPPEPQAVAPTPTPKEEAVAATPAPLAEHEKMAAAEGENVACPTVRIHFRYDRAVLEENQKPLLDSAAKCLSDNKRQSVSIEGNADERGTEEYNRALGQRRADAVAQYLESKGAAPDQVQRIVSYGEDNPLCTEDDESCWKRNRRTAIRASCHM